MQERLQKIVDSKRFQAFITWVIVLAGVLVGLSTFKEIEARNHTLFSILDTVILGIFTVEILFKMGALWPKPQRFFNNGWNVFDFIIVAVCFLPLGGSYPAVLRLFRLLRVLRLVSVIPRLQVLVGAMLKSLPSMFYVSILLFLLFYIYGVLGVMLFAGNDPVHFGNLGVSILSLFRIVTLEDWTDIMYLQIYGSDVYDGYNQSVEGFHFEPNAMPVIGTIYFVTFVLLGTIIMLNLVIGVIINGMDEAQKEITDRALHEMLTHEDEEISGAVYREQKIKELKEQLSQVSEALERLK